MGIDRTEQLNEMDVGRKMTAANAHGTQSAPGGATQAGFHHRDAVMAINMARISPWRATQELMAGAGRILPPDGVLSLWTLQGKRRPHDSEQRSLRSGFEEPELGMGHPRS
jgi:hypothetical protein